MPIDQTQTQTQTQTISPLGADETQHSSAHEQKRFFKNISWTSLSMVMRIAFAGGALAVLGRLVDPATMGLYGMGWAAAMLGFTVSQSGAAQGIIALPKLDKEHLAAAQLLSALISVGIAIVIILSSPAVGAFYHNPKIAMAFVIAGLFVPLMSLAAVDIARAQKELQFSLLALVQTGGVVLSAATALLLARAHHGLIALFCLQGLVGPYTFILFRLSRRSTGFGRTTRQHMADVWHIGMHLSLSSLTSVVFWNVPQLVLAKMVSVESVGLFVFCSRIIQLVFNQLSNMVNTVVYPTFARYQADPQRVGRSFLQTVRFTYFCLMLPLIALAAAPRSFLRLYGGGQWVAADKIMFYLVLMQMIVALGANVFPTFMALGRPQVAWQWNLFITAVQSLAILVTAHFGLLTIVKGLVVSSMVMPLAVYLLSKAAHFSFLDYWRNMAFLVGFLPVAIALGSRMQHLLAKSAVIVTFLAASISATLLYIVLVVAFDGQARRFFLKGTRMLRARLSPAI